MSASFTEHKREKLAVEIATLQSLDIEQLKARWRNLYPTEAPARFSRDLLIGRWPTAWKSGCWAG
jgi:hypothetical protein